MWRAEQAPPLQTLRVQETVGVAGRAGRFLRTGWRVTDRGGWHNLARTRTTKKLAQRIDLNYFKRPTLLKRAKFWLSMALPAIALVWIAWHGLARDSRVYSAGRMTAAHAVLETECAACHVQTAATFSAKASDSACLSCHDGPMHHPA